MKRLLVVLSILILLFSVSCSSTETVDEVVPAPAVSELPVERTAEIDEVPEVVAAVPEEEKVDLSEIPADSPAEPTEIVEQTAPEVVEEEKSTASLTGRELVEELSGEILPVVLSEQSDERGDAQVDATIVEKEDVEVAEEPFVIDSVENSVVDDAPAVSAEKPSGMAVMDRKMDDGVIGLLCEMIAIIVLFTLGTVIRSRYGHQLPISISLVLALLLALVPFMVHFILAGWSYPLLGYFILLLSFFVFRSRRS